MYVEYSKKSEHQHSPYYQILPWNSPTNEDNVPGGGNVPPPGEDCFPDNNRERPAECFLAEEDSPVCAGISLHAAGEMSLRSGNLTGDFVRLLSMLQIPRGSVSRLKQIHSHTVRVVGVPGRIGDVGDGLISTNPKAFLAVSVADCLPIFLFDRKTGVYGIVHSGWRGTGIVATAVEIMVDRLGSRTEDIHTCIGPGIGKCCYTVPSERARLFQRRHGSETAEFRDSAWHLDLKTANLNILERLNVAAVTVFDECTCCNSRYYSFRRQGAANFACMAAFIGAIPAAARSGRIPDFPPASE